MEKIKVSIVVPIYNLEKYLPKQEIDKLIKSFNDKEQKAL